MTWVCAAMLAPAIALAQPAKTADQWYTEGENHYNLGDFPKAVEAFKKGFEAEPDESKKAAYLYNVAQAYRQAKDCSNAQFFYKRYLALKDVDTRKPLKADKRQEIEDRIKELEDCARQQEAIRQRPPDTNIRPGGDDSQTGTGGTKPPDPQVGDVGDGSDDEEEEEEEDGISETVTPTQPGLLSARFTGGAAVVSAGDLEVPVQATGALLAGYPLAINEQLTLELGGGFTFTPVPFQRGGMSRSAKLIGIFANVGATYEVIPKLGLRGDVGIGALLLGGASESPFTGDQVTTGALTMLHVRFGLSADYAFTPNLLATITPFAFSYSPAKDGLREDITAITAIDFMVGLGYRM